MRYSKFCVNLMNTSHMDVNRPNSSGLDILNKLTKKLNLR